MKAQRILTCACAMALALPFSSCSSQSSSTGGYDTAEPVANGEIPPWIAENSNESYDTGSYSPVSDSPTSYAYNPPAKPSVTKTSSSSKKSSVSSKTNKTGKTSIASNKKAVRKPTPAPKARTYVVKKGDTLGAIARKNGTTVQAIKKANGLKSDMIHINQTLSLPRSK